MTNCKMVMFDMDGTIVDSFAFHTRVFQKFLRKFNVFLDLERVGELIGNTLKHILSETLPEARHEEAFDYLSVFYKNHVDDLVAQLDVIDGAVGLIEEIKSKGVRVSLVTNSKKELVDRILCIKRMDDLFGDVVAADKNSLDKQSRCRSLIKQYALLPDEVLYVGDSSHDIALCNELNMKCCLVNNRTSWINKENFNIKTDPPDYVVGDIRECLEIIG